MISVGPIELDLLELVRYVGGFSLRYFAVAGVLTWLLHVAFKHRAEIYRIQSVYPSRREVAGEIRWSMTNALCTGLSTMLVLGLGRAGYTSTYTSIDEHGWAWLAASIVLGVAGYDAWFYWQHRLLHTPWLFEHVHSVHHRSVNPTPLATFAHHPVETFMGNAFFVLFVLLVPVHPLALGVIGLTIFSAGILAHLGYEPYARGFAATRLFGWLNTATHHNMHHTHEACNFGLWSQLWDRAMGTNHPAYADAFDAVTARRSRPRAGDSAGVAAGNLRGLRTPDVL